MSSSAAEPSLRRRAESSSGRTESGQRQEDLGLFECNICYDLAREPVITRCGHLYCWACFYTWMQTKPHCKTCPVCKAGTHEDKVTPIYGRGREPVDPRKIRAPSEDRPQGASEVPQRPPGHRAPAVDVRPAGNGLQQLTLQLMPKPEMRGALVVADPMLHGHGALHSFSALFGLHTTSPQTRMLQLALLRHLPPVGGCCLAWLSCHHVQPAEAAGRADSEEPMTQEQRSQAFVSKILLMLGSFVIMCLLLF